MKIFCQPNENNDLEYGRDWENRLITGFGWLLQNKKALQWIVFFAGLLFLLSLEAWMRPLAYGGVYFQWWSSEHMMQTAPLLDLRDRPLESLYYLHIQPPVLDIIRAGLAQFWPGADPQSLLVNVDLWIYKLWVVVYAAILALIFHWLAELTSNAVALAGTLVFMLHPAAILYASFLESTMLFTLGLLWSNYELWKLSKHRGSVWGLALAVVFTFFVRSAFQWPVVLIFATSLLLVRVPLRKTMTFILVSGMVIGLWTYRQYRIFGTPYTSSFAGHNCYHGLGYFPQYDDYGLGPIEIPRIANASVLLRQDKLVPGVLNFNNEKHLAYNKELMKRCPELLLSQPWQTTAIAYLGNLMIYLQPSSHFTTPHIIADNLPWRDLYNALFSGISLLILMTVFGGWWLRRNRRTGLLVALGMALPSLYIFATSILFERGENMRYKFYLETLIFVFIVCQLYESWKLFKSRNTCADMSRP